MKKYRLGKVSFGSKDAKIDWIINLAIHSLEYIGKETKLSFTENELRKLAIKDLKKVIKYKKKKNERPNS
jgi:hypothetical protein